MIRVPICPDCEETMAKAWIDIVGQGERAVWVCGCSGMDTVQLLHEIDTRV